MVEIDTKEEKSKKKYVKNSLFSGRGSAKDMHRQPGHQSFHGIIPFNQFMLFSFHEIDPFNINTLLVLMNIIMFMSSQSPVFNIIR